MSKRKKKVNKPQVPLILLVGGGIALIVAAFLLINQNRPAPAAQAPIAEEIPYPEIARASLEEAKAALDSGSAILLDVRSAEAFAGQHIAGAVNIPTAEIETRLGELDPNAWIIPYCTWPNEESSARAASILIENGFTNVTPLLGGFEAWFNSGYPVEP